HPEVVLADVREVRAAGAVPHRPDALGRRPEPLVDLDVPFSVRLDTGLLQPDTVGVRRAAPGDEQVRPLDRAAARVEADGPARSPLYAIDGGPGPDLDPLVPEEPLDRLADVRVLAVDQRAVPLDDGHAAAEAAERLSQLEADVAAAQDDQVSRELSQIQGLDVGQRARLREPGGVVHPGARRGVDDDGLSTERPGPARVERDLDRLRRDEAPLAHDELRAALPVLLQVERDQSVHHLPLAVADGSHVDLPVAAGDPELGA